MFYVTRRSKITMGVYSLIIGGICYGAMYVTARGIRNSANDIVFQLDNGINPITEG